MVQIYLDQKENKIEVGVGEIFMLVLAVNSSAGYILDQPKFDNSVLRLVGTRSEVPARGIGNPMLVQVTFEALSPGEHIVTFERKRPWNEITFVTRYKIIVK